MSVAIPVKLSAFEGPLDLLLHLIEINKVDIYDIPVSEITDQYLAYIDRMGQENMDVTSEFLVMAATLLDIKSRMLLPRKESEKEEEEGDPRDELVRRLAEYKIYKLAASELRDFGVEASRNLYRSRDLPKEVEEYREPIDYGQLVGDTTLSKLHAIFSDVLKKYRDRHNPVRGGFGTIVREEISVEKRQLYIRAYLHEHRHTDFRSLLQDQESREGVIVTFLVVLELIKDGEIRVSQSESFGEITIDAAGEEKDTKRPVRYEALEQRGVPARFAAVSEHIISEDERGRWKTDNDRRRWRQYCLPWVMPWKSALLRRRWSVRRRKFVGPQRHWKRVTKRREAALKSTAMTTRSS